MPPRQRTRDGGLKASALIRFLFEQNLSRATFYDSRRRAWARTSCGCSKR
jgi:hypothetical protein